MTQKRLLSYDAVRVVAVMMIVMIHVSAYVVQYDKDPASLTFAVGNIFNGLSRAGTPMFLMLSGALLLNEDRKMDARTFYRRNLTGIVLLLLFWLFFYAAWRAVLLPWIQGMPADPVLFRDYLLRLRGPRQHLWYLFMLVGAYLVIPVLRLFVKRENKNYILGLILLSIVVQFGVRTGGLLTRGQSFTLEDFVTKFHVEYATGYLPYLLIGWYLTAFPPRGWARVALPAAGIAALVFQILAVRFLIGAVPDIRDYMMEMDTLPAMVYGAGLFAWITGHFEGRETKSKVIAGLSLRSFGIYITHVFLLDILIGLLFPYTAFGEQHPLVYTIVLYVSGFCAAFLVSLCLSKVKGLRKLVRG